MASTVRLHSIRRDGVTRRHTKCSPFTGPNVSVRALNYPAHGDLFRGIRRVHVARDRRAEPVRGLAQVPSFRNVARRVGHTYADGRALAYTRVAQGTHRSEIPSTQRQDRGRTMPHIHMYLLELQFWRSSRIPLYFQWDRCSGHSPGDLRALAELLVSRVKSGRCAGRPST
jgi:hypothetical protein